MSIVEKLLKLQIELETPKMRENNFGGYLFRSAEDILESCKALQSQEKVIITLSDELVLVGDRFYIKATAVISDGEAEIKAVAYAREPEVKKGYDPSQITGAASSYARKYALCGLLAIDNNKDADATNKHNENDSYIDYDSIYNYLLEQLSTCTSLEALSTFGKVNLEKINILKRESKDMYSKLKGIWMNLNEELKNDK